MILISGVGLLLLSLTNRFARAVDRSRQLSREMRGAPEEDRLRLEGQVDVLFRRARVIQISIVLATMVLLAAVSIIALFLTALMQIESAVLLIALFICCLITLIASLIAFLADIHLSLKALKMELGDR